MVLILTHFIRVRRYTPGLPTAPLIRTGVSPPAGIGGKKMDYEDTVPLLVALHRVSSAARAYIDDHVTVIWKPLVAVPGVVPGSCLKAGFESCHVDGSECVG